MTTELPESFLGEHHHACPLRGCASIHYSRVLSFPVQEIEAERVLYYPYLFGYWGYHHLLTFAIVIDDPQKQYLFLQSIIFLYRCSVPVYLAGSQFVLQRVRKQLLSGKVRFNVTGGWQCCTAIYNVKKVGPANGRLSL